MIKQPEAKPPEAKPPETQQAEVVLTPANAMLNSMPVPLMTFDVTGKLTFANRQAQNHPGNLTEVVASNNETKLLIAKLIAGKVKLPCNQRLELASGERIDGQFIAGPEDKKVSFIAQAAKRGRMEAPEPRRVTLTNIITFIGTDLNTPLSLVNSQLKSLKDTGSGAEIEQSIRLLKQRFTRINEVLAMFGDDVVNMNDRVEFRPAIEEILLELEDKITASNVIFEVIEQVKELPPIYGNKPLLMKALFESMDNAITQSRREVKGKQSIIIRMRFAITGEFVFLSVFNRGALVGGGKRIEVLETFVDQEDAAITKLGLGMVQRIIGMHGGNIHVNGADDDTVEVKMEFPTGPPRMQKSVTAHEQARRYAEDIAKLISKKRKSW
jgi:signal transduction histidine kinase